MLLRSSCTAGPERLRGSRSGAVVSRRGRRGTKKRQRTRLCRFSHHVPSRKITKRSIAQPRQCRGQSRRYHPRSHPPILPERRIRRICPLSVLSPPAPGDASRPRLYLVFDIIAPLYADCKGKNEKFAFPSQWDFGSFAGVPRRGAGVRPVPGRGGVRRRPQASKPFPVRTGVPGKPGGFAAVPPRGCAPHSSSGQTALYSGRPAGEGIPHTAPLPLLFPTATATPGCGGGPLLVAPKRRCAF